MQETKVLLKWPWPLEWLPCIMSTNALDIVLGVSFIDLPSFHRNLKIKIYSMKKNEDILKVLVYLTLVPCALVHCCHSLD